jgi:hypothetical protein
VMGITLAVATTVVSAGENVLTVGTPEASRAAIAPRFTSAGNIRQLSPMPPDSELVAGRREALQVSSARGWS